MTRVEVWRKVATGSGHQLERRGRDPRPMAGGATAPAFTLGVTEPTADNSGAGTYVEANGTLRAAPTIVVNGDVTVGAGQVYQDRIINGRVFLNGSVNPGTLRNCVVRGPAAAPTTGSARPLVEIQGTPTTLAKGAPQALIENVTIRPQTASDFWDGIGRKNFRTVRCLIEDINDGWQVFSTTADGIVNVTDDGSCLTQMVQFRPDRAYNNTSPRAETHNDGLQNQGSLDEPVFTGTAVNARHSTTRSNPLPPTRTQIAAFMLNSNTQSRSGIILRRCWVRGGIFAINAGLPSGYVEITDCRFERPGTAADGRAPDRAISIASTVSRVVARNTYIDNGATVPVSNG